MLNRFAKFGIYFSVLSAILFSATIFFVVPASGASITWDGGGGDNNWSTCANWSGDTCPGASDIAIFDGTSTKDATVDASFAGSVAGLQLNSGYTGTVSLSRSLTIGTSDFLQEAGTFALSNQTLTLNTSDFTITGGTFDDGTGTVVFDGNALTVNISTSLELYNVTVDNNNAFQPVTISSGDTLVVKGTLTLTNGAINGPGAIEMEGMSTVVGSFGTRGTAPIEYLVAGNQTITGSGGYMPGILINKPGDSLSQTGDIVVFSADFELQSGTYVVGANTLSFDTCDFTVSGGTFNSSSSTIVFDGNAQTFDVDSSLSLNNVTIDLNNSSQALTIATGDTLVVTGTLNLNLGKLNGPGVLEMEGGNTVVGSNGVVSDGTGKIKYLTAGDQTITGSGGGIPGLLINKPSGTITQVGDIDVYTGDFELQSGTYVVGANSLSLRASDFTISGGTFTSTGSTVIFDDNALTVDVPTSLELNNLTFDNSNNLQPVTISSGDTLIVNGTLTFNLGRLDGPGSLEMRGANTIVGSNGVTSNGTGKVQYLVARDQTITGSGGGIPGLFINKPSGTITQSGDIDVYTGDFELQSGTYVVGANILTLNTADFTATGGTFTANGSTLAFTGNAGVIDVDNTITFHNLTIAKNNSAQAQSIATGDIVVVTGTLSLNGNGPINGPGTINMQGEVTTVAGLSGGSVELTYSGSANQTYQLTSGNEPDGNVTINKTGGSLSLLSSLDLDAAGQTLTIVEGTLDLSGFAVTVTGALTVQDGGVLEMYGNETITRGSLDLQNGSTVSYTGDGDAGSDSYTLNTLTTSYHHLRINSTDGATDSFAISASPFTVGGNFVLTAGIVTGGSATINVAGNWANTGTFTAGTSTVVLNGTSQTISGSTIFNNLTKSVSSADTLTFTNGTTQTITGTMALDGDSGQLLSLRSDSAGDQWNIDPQGTRTIEYLDVKDSNNTNATIITVTGLNITDSGNNTNWGFNSAPSFTVTVSDGGSSGSSPTNVGASVTFTATATDSNGDQYYLAICKTNAVTAGSNDAPTCDGGSWAISSATNSASQASVTRTALVGDSESNVWYAFVCDKTSSSAACSGSSQGSGDSGSPFKVNHAPSYSATTSSASAVDAGDSVTIATTSSDSDTDTVADTVSLYVCKSNDATSAGCGAGGTWCSATAQASDPSCAITTSSDQTPSFTYYAYIYDSHGLAASTNPSSGSVTVNSVGGGVVLLPPPEIKVVLNKAMACGKTNYLNINLTSDQAFRARLAEASTANFTPWTTYNKTAEVNVEVSPTTGKKSLILQRFGHHNTILTQFHDLEVIDFRQCESGEVIESEVVNTPSYHIIPDRSKRIVEQEVMALRLYTRLFRVLPNNGDAWRLHNYLAYGGEINKRSLEKEGRGLVQFVRQEKRLPKSSLDWRIVAVLGYGTN